MLSLDYAPGCSLRDGGGQTHSQHHFNGRSFPQLHQQQLCEMTGVTEQRRRSL